VAVAQIFKALGDPVRLEIVRRLTDGSTYTMSNLSKDLGLTRQGARKQIQVLVSANVLQLKPVGREIKVTLDAASLELARSFIANLENQWDQRLKALKDLTEQ
jgi:DNA-binding transcriptional ArsR family regulator